MNEYNEEDIKVSHIKKELKIKPKIVAIGVGGGGSNAISHLAEHWYTDDIDMIAVNTDLQHLNGIENPKVKKLQIGKELTKGLG